MERREDRAGRDGTKEEREVKSNAAISGGRISSNLLVEELVLGAGEAD